MTIAQRESLRAKLAALGFDVVRFASAKTTPAGAFEEWISAGHHAAMDWLPRSLEKRVEIGRVLAATRTVICLAVNYLPEGRAGAQERWSKYALYRDYHLTMTRALRSAGQLLETEYNLGADACRWYVDTGPVLERGWASIAGLGWQGKNAMLISRTHGNWLFLATVLTQADIPADEPLPGVEVSRKEQVGTYCGTCARCLSACPTDAFARPGWVDARRCIAYHTIENRGIIPRELRSRFGGRIFGCDTCLDVCPWNRFARAGRSALLSARFDIGELNLLEILSMDEARFRDVFRQTPIKRTKLSGLLRNACIAAGNWHECDDWHFGKITADDVAAAVADLCRHASPIVRVHAVWALHRLLGVEKCRKQLASILQQERDPDVLNEYQAWPV